jgi:hypothetical protein
VGIPQGQVERKSIHAVALRKTYLASKADALRRRDKNKDAYDIVWLAESWPGGQEQLAREIRGTSIAGDVDFLEALRVLDQEFLSIDSAGAVKYARFMAEDATSHDRLARQAVGAVATLLRALRA